LPSVDRGIENLRDRLRRVSHPLAERHRVTDDGNPILTLTGRAVSLASRGRAQAERIRVYDREAAAPRAREVRPVDVRNLLGRVFEARIDRVAEVVLRVARDAHADLQQRE